MINTVPEYIGYFASTRRCKFTYLGLGLSGLGRCYKQALALKGLANKFQIG